MIHSITADARRQALSFTDIAPAGRRTFVRDQTLGSLLRDTSSLYFSNFRTIILCYFLPTFPVVLIQAIGDSAIGVAREPRWRKHSPCLKRHRLIVTLQ